MIELVQVRYLLLEPDGPVSLNKMGEDQLCRKDDSYCLSNLMDL